MVVCKFFLEGRCRFGTNCKNEHTQNRSLSYQQQSFNQPVRQQYFPQQQQLQRTGESQQPILENLLSVVKDDATNSMRGGQWLFSCYAPLLRKFTKAAFNNNEENLPNLVDYSPEELRWEAISSNMKGQFHDYTTKLQLLSQSYHTIQRALQNLDQATSNFIVQYERGENVSPAGTALASSVPYFSATNVNVTSSPSQFSFALPSTQPHQGVVAPFKFQLPSQQPAAAAPFSFKLPSQLPAAPVAAPFTFQPAQQPAQQHAQQQSAAAPSFSFKLPSQLPMQSAVNSSVNTQAISHIAENSSYGPQLSQTNIQQFKADKFSFGKIPRIPPPKELR